MQGVYRMLYVGLFVTAFLDVAYACGWVHVLPVPCEEKVETVIDYERSCTIEWHVTEWTTVGYNVNVTLYHFRDKERVDPCYHFDEGNGGIGPCWTLGWTWVGEEVIEGVIGGRVVDGDPSVVSDRITTVFKKSRDTFAMIVAAVGNKKKRIRIPINFNFEITSLRYTCGPSTLVKPPKQMGTNTAWRVTCVLSPSEKKKLEDKRKLEKKTDVHDELRR